MVRFKGFQLDGGPSSHKEPKKPDNVMRALDAGPKASFNGGGVDGEKPEGANNLCVGKKEGARCSGYLMGNGMRCGPYSGTCKGGVCSAEIPADSPCLPNPQHFDEDEYED